MSKTLEYPVATMRRALALYEAGWRPARIQDFLEEEGYGRPSRSTIYTWINPAYRQRCIEATRQRGARQTAANARFRLSSSTDEYKEAFMVRLRREGIPCATIAKVCGVVFGESLTAGEVRERLREVSPVHGNFGKPRKRAA